MPSCAITPKKIRIGRTFGRIARKPMRVDRNIADITTKMTPSAIVRLSICPGDDVRRRAGQQHERAGELHRQVLREVLRDVLADLRERRLDAARAREARADEDARPSRSPA
jgi:hypothetical protein